MRTLALRWHTLSVSAAVALLYGLRRIASRGSARRARCRKDSVTEQQARQELRPQPSSIPTVSYAEAYVRARLP